MTDEVEREYPYRYSAAVVFGPTVGFGTLGALMLWMALTSEEGFVLFNLFEVSPLGARIMAWVFAVFFLGLFVACVPVVVNFLTTRRRLAFTENTLLVPRGFWSTAVRPIPYGDIVELVPHVDVQGNRSLIVRWGAGKFPIEEIALPSKTAFEEINSLLRERRVLAVMRQAPSPPERPAGAGE